MRFATKAIRAAQPPDPTTGAVITPIHPSVTYVFREIGVPNAFEYSRSANPTRTTLEKCLAELEGAEFGLAFSSGMAAVDAVCSILRPGDHIVSACQIYGGTHRLFETVCKGRGISVSYVEGSDPANFAAALRPETRLAWIETPTNPLLHLVDVEAVSKITRDAGVTLVADNTFPSPFLQQPLAQGADVVLHSTTKYIGGHSDVLGGAVLTNNRELYDAFQFYQNTVGAVLGPFDAWLTLRGVKTLPVRMRQHTANALAVALFLDGHPAVERVYYPGLESHPQHELARRQMSGFGAIVTFALRGGREEANQFVKALRLFYFAESLGGVESLACHPATMSHATMSEEDRLKLGITEGTIRLSVGIEDSEDLVEDLARALDA